MPLLAICLGLISAQTPVLPSAQAKALEFVRQAGGVIAWVKEDDHQVLCIDYSLQGVTLDLAPLEALTPLYALRIMGPTVPASEFRHLRKLPDLGLLVVTHSGVTDDGMREIGYLVHLDKLDVRGDKLSAKGLTYLSRLRRLKRLFLYGSKLKDADIKPLESLTWLDQLELPPTVSLPAVAALKKKLAHILVERWSGN